MMTWTSTLPESWEAVRPRAIFRERSEPSKPGDIHLTPSQHYGVLTQADYMGLTGSRVVMNLSAPDNMKHVEPGDFIAHLRSFQGGIEKSDLRGKVSTAYTVITPLHAADSRYFKWVLKSSAFITELAASCEQLRDGQSVRFADFAKIRLPLPPRHEQLRIADFLDDRVARIDQILAARRSQVTLVNDVADGMTTRLLSEISADGPPLSALAQIVDTEHRTAPSVPDGGYWVAGTGAIRDGALVRSNLRETDRQSYLDWTSRGAPRPGDVLLTREAPVGQVALIRPDDPEIAIGQRVVLLKPLTHLLDGGFLRLVLMAGEMRAIIALKSDGSLHPHLNMSEISRIRIPAVSLEEQRRLSHQHAEILRENFARMWTLHGCIKLLREYKTSLITAAVTGKFDVSTAGSGIPG